MCVSDRLIGGFLKENQHNYSLQLKEMSLWAMSWVWPLHEDVGIHHLGFVVDKVVLVHIFLHVLLSSPVSIIPPVHRTHSFVLHES